MSTHPEPVKAPETEAPLDAFSQCHAGIVAQLDQLARLPALLEPAAQARQIAGSTAKFFRQAVYEHHSEEERELFPAVLASAQPGDVRAIVQAMVIQLLQQRSFELDPLRPQKGVNFVLKPGAVTESSALITLSLKQATLLDTLKLVTEVAGLSYRFEGELVVIEPK